MKSVLVAAEGFHVGLYLRLLLGKDPVMEIGKRSVHWALSMMLRKHIDKPLSSVVPSSQGGSRQV